MDIYYEQNVVNNNIDEQQRKTKTLNFIKAACIIFGGFTILGSVAFFGLWWVMITGLAISVPFFAAAIVISKINKRGNTEYDYVLTDETLTVSEIYYRTRRKVKYRIPLRSIESVGVFDSPSYKRAQAACAKRLLALVNFDDEKYILFIVFSSEKGKAMLFLEPDRMFIGTLRRCVSGSYGIIDQSVSELDKRLAIREANIAGVADGGDEYAPLGPDKPDETSEQAQEAQNNANGGDGQ